MDGLIKKFSHRKDLLNCTLVSVPATSYSSYLENAIDWLIEWKSDRAMESQERVKECAIMYYANLRESGDGNYWK